MASQRRNASEPSVPSRIVDHYERRLRCKGHEWTSAFSSIVADLAVPGDPGRIRTCNTRFRNGSFATDCAWWLTCCLAWFVDGRTHGHFVPASRFVLLALHLRGLGGISRRVGELVSKRAEGRGKVGHRMRCLAPCPPGCYAFGRLCDGIPSGDPPLSGAGCRGLHPGARPAGGVCIWLGA